MSDTKFLVPLFISIAAVVFAVLGIADRKIANAIKSEQVAPAIPSAHQHLKCDTIIRSNDTIFMFSKSK